MQGLHVFEPKTRMVIDLESFIPKDHLLRQIDRIVEPAFIRKLTAACYPLEAFQIKPTAVAPILMPRWPKNEERHESSRTRFTRASMPAAASF